MIKDIKLGFVSYINAIKFIHKHKMWTYLIFPILLFVGIYYLGFTFESLKDEYAHNRKDVGIILKIWYFFVMSFFMLLSYALLNLTRYILIILLSPVLSVVSEKTERILTGNKYKFNLKQLIKDIKRTMNLSLRNVIWELGIDLIIVVSVLILSWIFGVNLSIISTTLIMVVAFYYYGFGFIDYLNERMRLNIEQSVKFVKKHRGFAVALGSVFTLLFHYTNMFFLSVKDDVSNQTFFWIIIASSIIMAIIPILTITAATLGVHELVDLSKNKYALKEKAEEVINENQN